MWPACIVFFLSLNILRREVLWWCLSFSFSWCISWFAIDIGETLAILGQLLGVSWMFHFCYEYCFVWIFHFHFDHDVGLCNILLFMSSAWLQFWYHWCSSKHLRRIGTWKGRICVFDSSAFGVWRRHARWESMSFGVGFMALCNFWIYELRSVVVHGDFVWILHWYSMPLDVRTWCADHLKTIFLILRDKINVLLALSSVKPWHRSVHLGVFSHDDMMLSRTGVVATSIWRLRWKTSCTKIEQLATAPYCMCDWVRVFQNVIEHRSNTKRNEKSPVHEFGKL